MNSILSEKLGYQFINEKLMEMALTHRSKGGEHNERLEFLGDAVVNFVIADILYHQFSDATEGDLSRWRATLVNRDALADLAKQLELGEHLLLGAGELRSGGKKRQSILSCTMEAVIGAVYLDGGFAVASQCIKKWYQSRVASLSSAADHKDPKTLLQEKLQARRLGLPVYAVDKTEGEAHKQLFTVSCCIDALDKKALGKGTSRRRAEQDAAEKMLLLLNKDN